MKLWRIRTASQSCDRRRCLKAPATKSSIWNGRGGAYEFLVLELRPQVGRNGVTEGGQILLDLGARNRAGDDRGDDWVPERKLEGGGRQRHAVAGADLLDLSHPLENGGAGRLVIVHRARNGAGCENSRIIAAADNNADAAFGATREFAVEHVLLEQGVAHRQQEEIDVEEIKKPGNHPHHVQPGPYPLDDSLTAQFVERTPAGSCELDEIGVDVRLTPVAPCVKIVDQQEVDAVDPEALQAVLERAHHAVIAVVEHGLELQPTEPLVFDGPRLQRPTKDAPDLARDDEFAPGLPVERAAEAMFGLPAAVPGRGVEVARPALPRALNDRRRIVVLDPIEEVAKRRGSEAEFGQVDVRPAEFARFQGWEARAAHASGPSKSKKARIERPQFLGPGAGPRTIPQAPFRSATDSPSPRRPRCRGRPWSRRRPA